jgi:tripartite-type tricarboxylate transporter receptor subunit TctC
MKLNRQDQRTSPETQMNPILDERDFAHVGNKSTSLRIEDIAASQEFRQMYETLPNVVSAQDMPWERSPDGLIKHLVHHKMNTRERCVEAYMQFLKAGERSGKHRHMWEEVLFCVEGSGYDLHWDLKFDCLDAFQVVTKTRWQETTREGSMKQLIRVVALSMLLAAAAAPNARAQIPAPYPSRPITMNVPYAAGGPLDVMARVVADGLAKALGATIVVENIAGAGGSLGVGRAVRAAPDGYTLSAGNWSSHVANGAIYPLPYDLIRDLEPVSLLPYEADLIIARKDFPANSLGELIAWLMQNPGKASAGTSGIGGPSYMSAAFFAMRTGTRFTLVPYRGSGPALLDLVAGQLDIMITGPAIALPHVRDGAVKVYAVTAKDRIAAAPDIPTTDEAGLAGFYFSAWSGLWVPKGTRRDIIARLSVAVREALAEPTVRRRLAVLAMDIPPPETLGPETLGAFHRAEIEKWWPIIKATGIKGE